MECCPETTSASTFQKRANYSRRLEGCSKPISSFRKNTTKEPQPLEQDPNGSHPKQPLQKGLAKERIRRESHKKGPYRLKKKYQEAMLKSENALMQTSTQPPYQTPNWYRTQRENVVRVIPSSIL